MRHTKLFQSLSRPAPGSPAGVEDVGPPDFIGLGAQRSGTTWWFSLLLKHPDIAGNRGGRKELHYFDRFARQAFDTEDIHNYHRFFPRDSLLRGEWTPRYMFDFWVAELVARTAPDARLLIMLRDPIARFESGVKFHAGLLPSSVHNLALVHNEALARSRYAEQISWLLRFFSRSQILILQYERCQADPMHFLAQTFDFLGAKPFTLAESELSKRVGSITADSAEKPLPDGTSLFARLRPDVERLKELCPEIDLNLWPQFRDM